MNKKNNRKGFTTVELVIVIAVIAILATVLIPTFSGLISRANESNALQVASNARTAIMNQDLMPNDDFTLKTGDVVYICYTKDTDAYWYTLTSGQILAVADHTFADGKLTEAGEGKTPFAVEDIDETKIVDLPADITVYVKRAG